MYVYVRKREREKEREKDKESEIIRSFKRVSVSEWERENIPLAITASDSSLALASNFLYARTSTSSPSLTSLLYSNHLLPCFSNDFIYIQKNGDFDYNLLFIYNVIKERKRERLEKNTHIYKRERERD